MDQEGPQPWQLSPQLLLAPPLDACAAVDVQRVQRRSAVGCQRLHGPVGHAEEPMQTQQLQVRAAGCQPDASLIGELDAPGQVDRAQLMAVRHGCYASIYA